VHPVAGIPGPNGMLVFYWTPAWGWVAVPAGGSGSVGGGEARRRGKK
jgi:arabinogalactan endo-1,4-beta-galactosidase